MSCSLAHLMKKSGGYRTKLVFSLLVVAILSGVIYFSGDISWRAIGEAMARFPVTSLLAVLCLAAAQIGFMIFRFWALLPSGTNAKWDAVANAVAVGQFVNTFLPARAGDVLKAVILSREGAGKAVPVMKGAGTLIADKLVDIGALVVIIGLTGAYAMPGWDPSLPSPKWIVIGVGLVVVAVLLTLPLWRGHVSRFSAWLKQFGDGLSGMIELPRLASALLIGLCAWSSEALALKFLVEGQGYAVTFSQAVFVLAVLNLAIAVPISVANLGTFEASIVFALGQLGLPVNESIAIATVHHAMQWLGITAWALATTWQDRRSRASGEFRVQLEDKMKAIEYFEKVSSDYDGTVSKGILKIPRDLERAAVLKFACLNSPGKSLLDVGCGAGFYSLEAKRCGMHVHAVDASAGMVLRLQGKVDEAEVADIEKLEMGRTYDRVVCAGVLDFVLHPELAFRNLCQVVSPGGRLIVLAPRRGPGGLFYRVEKFFFGIRINLYTRGWFSRIAGEYGLSLVDFTHPLPTNMALLFERTR